ncbi:hypothetical protein [Vulcanisaeta distributa]|uniref:hypothetical protein n=1 Tax=Vulcanisaeta distributa TaxID=164451 RepID=UPI001FB2AEF2|nr:hypothetical protein [Vulcanisaeta distributa]
MSIEETKTKLMMLRDTLTRIEGINHALDELPKILINALIIIAVIMGTLITSIIIYIITAQTITLLPSGLSILTIITLLVVVPYYVYTRIDKSMKSTSTYSDWDSKLQLGISGILEILSTLDFDGIEYKINRARIGYALVIIIKLLALSILLFLVVFMVTSALIMVLGYTYWTWYTMVMAIIIDIAITLALSGMVWSMMLKDCGPSVA